MRIHIHKDRLALFFILGLAFALRIAYLDKSLSGDEIITVLRASEEIPNILHRVAQESSHPPLQHIILHFWLSMGNSDWWIRLLYVLMGMGACYAVYLTGREYIDKNFGLICMFIFSILPISVWASQFVRSYIFGAFFIGLSLFFLLRIFNSENCWMSWIGYTVSSLLSIYSFYFSLSILIAENIFVLFNWKKFKKILFGWFTVQVIIFTLFLPWLLFFQKENVFHHNVVMFKKGFYLIGIHVGGITRAIAGTLGFDPFILSRSSLHDRFSMLNLFIISILAIFILLTVFLLAIKYFKTKEKAIITSPFLFPLLVCIPLILAFFAERFKGVPVLPRYFVCNAMIFSFILVGFFSFFKSNYIKIGFFTVIFILFLSRLPAVYSSGQDWRGLVKYIESEADTKNECLIFFKDGKSSYDYYAHHQIHSISVSKYFQRNADSGDYEITTRDQTNALNERLRSYSSLWAVFVHQKVFSGEELLRKWFINNGYTEIKTKNFNGVSLIFYKKINSDIKVIKKLSLSLST